MKAEQERVKTLLLSTVTQLCQNGLIFKKDIKVQGLLAITIDDSDIFVVQLNENIGKETDHECAPVAGLPELSAAVTPVGFKDFPGAGKAAEVLATPQTATGEEHIAQVGGQKVSPQFAVKLGRETTFVHNGDHGKMDENTMNFGSAVAVKDATDNASMLLPAFGIPMTVNYSAMKSFQGVECFRDANSDQIDYVFQDFQASASAVPNDPGRLTCQSVTAASSVPCHVQTGFPTNLGQTYQHFASMISAAPQNSAKLDMLGIGKRVLPQASGQLASFAGQPQVTTKKQKQESRLPRRPRESTEKRFRCQLCSLTYYYKKHLKFHMQQKHGFRPSMT